MKAKKASKPQSPRKANDIPATQKNLFLVREELNHELTSHRLETRAGFQRMDSKFKSLEARMDSLDAKLEARIHSLDAKVEARIHSLDAKVEARFHSLDARLEASIDRLDAKLEKAIASIHRTLAIVEEQEARNKYVLDGYAQIYSRMDKIEKSKKDV